MRFDLNVNVTHSGGGGGQFKNFKNAKPLTLIVSCDERVIQHPITLSDKLPRLVTPKIPPYPFLVLKEGIQYAHGTHMLNTWSI